MKNLLRTAVLLLTASFAFAQRPKVAPDLAGIDSKSKVDVIIQFRHVPTEAQHQKVRNLGGTLKGRLALVKGALYTVPVSGVATLANDPEVAYVSPDRPLGGISNADDLKRLSPPPLVPTQIAPCRSS